MKLNSVEEIVEDIRKGKMVIIMDDESRENEGDLVMAATLTRPQDINFMATHGRGLICLTLSAERCRQLRLPLMVNDNSSSFSTNFTVSIEAAEGVTTGISAADRAKTIQAAVAPEAKPEDIVQPGHIFPIMAQKGGVLTRAGHTEAGCDLARLAGLEPAATIVEILNEDGTMARRPDLEVFAKKHNIKIGTIEDLIRFRVQHERSIEPVTQTPFETRYGTFQLHTYRDATHSGLHMALVMGEPKSDKPFLVRVHVEDLLCDTLGGKSNGRWPLNDAIKRVAEKGEGCIVLLRPATTQESLIGRIKNFQQQVRPPQPQPSSPEDIRTFGIGAQILLDLGVRKMCLMSAPKRFHALGGFDLEVTDYMSE